MLQRLLSEFLNQAGIEQAMMFDDRGRLLSAVAPKGQLPATDRAVSLTSAAHDSSQQLGLGDLHEVWIEGDETVMIDIITPYRILMLNGTNGNIARWRHTTDHLRRQLATTPEI